MTLWREQIIGKLPELDSLTQYPSIPTYHELDGKGVPPFVSAVDRVGWLMILLLAEALMLGIAAARTTFSFETRMVALLMGMCGVAVLYFGFIR